MINFIKKRRLWYSISLTIITIGLIFMVKNYQSMNHIFNLGIDFTGGTSITLRFNTSLENIETKLRENLIAVGLEKHSVQSSGLNDYIIKTEEMDVNKRNQLFQLIETNIASFDTLEVDIIGPSIGDELRRTSFFIIIAVSIAILIYCSWRFELIYGLAAIIALLHDALILITVTAIFKFEVNTAYVAALLTVLGYSINDTIVIFDRIREHIKKTDDAPTEFSKSLVNTAVNDMVPRSIHTTITTSLVVISIFLFGGLSLHLFASVLLVGLLTGTYSSLFIASPMILTISKAKGNPIVQ